MFLSCGRYEREANRFLKFFTGYLILRTLQALNFPVRWLRTTVNSTSSPVWSSKPSCTSFTWKNSFLLSPTSYVMKPNYNDKNKNSGKRNFKLTNTICVRWDGRDTGQANNQYLILDTLDQGSALRHHDTRHLLPSLSYCANLELHRFSFLKTVCLARHAHDSKGYFLAFTSPWNIKQR